MPELPGHVQIIDELGLADVVVLNFGLWYDGKLPSLAAAQPALASPAASLACRQPSLPWPWAAVPFL